jgi:hypothetical protein
VALKLLKTSKMSKCRKGRDISASLPETGVGADVMKPMAAPIVGGMVTSTIHVLILEPVLFALMKERALRRGTLGLQKREGVSKMNQRKEDGPYNFFASGMKVTGRQRFAHSAMPRLSSQTYGPAC